MVLATLYCFLQYSEKLLTVSLALRQGTSFEDAFKTATDPFWQKAWIDRVEPFLQDYKSYYGTYYLYYRVTNIKLTKSIILLQTKEGTMKFFWKAQMWLYMGTTL